MSSSVERLLAYSRLDSLSSTERTLALVTARWLRVEPGATTDPLLADLWSSVRLAEGRTPFDKATPSFDSTPFDLIMAKSAGTHRAPTSSSPPSGNIGASATRSLPTITKPRSITDYFMLGGESSSPAPPSAPVAPPSAPVAPPSAPVAPPSVPVAPLVIYCDGACSANGRRGARAGYGVSVWNTDSPNSTRREVKAISRRLDDMEPQTNQRAELRGLSAALQIAVDHGAGADIYTDSQYAMNCLQTWGAGWAAKGWRKADGAPVLHQDLLKPMWDLWKRRGSHIQLHHVAAHTGRADMHSRGNARADELATKSIEQN